MKQDAKVYSKSAAMNAMDNTLELSRALMGGTKAMREAGSKYLIKWPNEETAAYDARLKSSVLFPAYKRTVATLTGKPFSKPLTIGEDTPENIREWLDDIDLQGRKVDVFAAEILEAAIAHGLAGILVEYPEGTQARTQADERSMGLRPYWVAIMPWQLLGWRAAREGGNWVIKQLRYTEEVEEEDGEFGSKTVEQIRVLEPGKWTVYRKVEKKDGGEAEWTQTGSGATTLTRVPYVPIYGKRTGFMTGEPPLLELAHLNVKHWQSQSDQDALLHVARVPILTAVGVDADTFEFTVGASAAVKLPVGAKMGYVEHSGSSIGAGMASLEALKEEMRQAGAELLVLAPGQITATQVMSENAVGMCALQRIVLDFEDALDLALQYTAEWVKLADGGSVTLFNDFGAATLAEASAQLLLTANSSGKVSDETLFKELQRRGILAPDIDYDDERERIEAQGSGLGEIAPPEVLPEEAELPE